MPEQICGFTFYSASELIKDVKAPTLDEVKDRYAFLAKIDPVAVPLMDHWLLDHKVDSISSLPKSLATDFSNYLELVG